MCRRKKKGGKKENGKNKPDFVEKFKPYLTIMTNINSNNKGKIRFKFYKTLGYYNTYQFEIHQDWFWKEKKNKPCNDKIMYSKSKS